MAKSKEDFGSPLEFDPNFRGPLKNRSCTDVICLFLFLVFIVCWLGIGIYAFTNGNLQAILLPKDSRGQVCGLDEEVKDKPYLLFFDLTKCLGSPDVIFNGCRTKQLCVEKCPEKVFVKESSGENADPMFCDGSDCPKWYLPSFSFEHRCFPKAISKEDLDKLNIIDSDKILQIITNPKGLIQIEQAGADLVKDVTQAWLKILVGVLLAAVVCLIYIFLMRWIAAVMVYLSIVGVVVLEGLSIYLSVQRYIDLKNHVKQDNGSLGTNQTLWLVLAIFFSILGLITVLLLLFLRKRIVLAIALIEEGSKAVGSVTSVLVFPIVPWVLQVLVIVFTIFTAMLLTSCGTKTYTITADGGVWKKDQSCDPSSFKYDQNYYNTTCKMTVQHPPLYPYLHTINIFGFFWLAFFATALGEMILAGVFSQWYWTWDKKNLPFFAVTSSFARTFRYHLGTLAFGSLIIAICRMIRVALEYIDHKLKKYDNGFVHALLCCLKCFFWCLEKFLKFINKNAYIMCAVHGKNFCASAKDAFSLLMRNIIRVVVLDKVVDFVFFLSKLLITLGVGSVAYLCIATDLTSLDNSELSYPVALVVIIMVLTYFIASICFNVYSMAVDTLFLCFLEDCERNDGSPQKPYFMTSNLMRILGKKNKKL